MPALKAVDVLKSAVRANDPVRAGNAVDCLRRAGHNYRDCYRIALAGNPDLTENDWEDLMARADGEK